MLDETYMPGPIRWVLNWIDSRSHSRRVKLGGWGEAETFTDVGELTARWLLGEIPEQPGYNGGPDDETAELADTLARVSRAGYVTLNFQPAFDGPGYDGAQWQQREAVQGFVEDRVTLARLADAADHAGLLVIVNRSTRSRGKDTRVTVTRRKTEDNDWAVAVSFGWTFSRPELRWTLYEGCGPAAVEAMCNAWQLTLVDPVWGGGGRVALVLDAFAAARKAG